MNQISEVTRRDIMDLLINGFTYTVYEERIDSDFFSYQHPVEIPVNINYCGRLNEIDFLERIYKLDELPSYDNRFKTARSDIWQHTINNDDYDPDWVFNDDRIKLSANNPDEIFLTFLSEIFHPAVRNDRKNWRALLDKINELLQPDGYCIEPSAKISGRDIYSWKNLRAGESIIRNQINYVKKAFDTNYVNTQMDLMYKMIEESPNIAIGKAKELIETCCKTILDEQNIEFELNIDLSHLIKITNESIGLSPKGLRDGIKGKDIASRILGSLGNITKGMSELRNLYGDGHGKNKNFESLPPRYAHLAVGSSVVLVQFMWDTYQYKKTIADNLSQGVNPKKQMQ